MRGSVAALLLIVLALAALLHGRRAGPFVTIVAGDEPQYLALADSFPDARLYDGKLYVLHPPLYPWAVHGAARLVGGSSFEGAVLLGVSGVLVAAGAAFGLARALGAASGGAALAAAIVGVSAVLERTSGTALREPWTTALVALALLLAEGADRAERADRAAGRARVLLAGACLALAALGLSWDGSLLIAPALALRAPSRRRSALLVAAFVLPWLVWASVRASVLAGQPDYPAGISGLVEEAPARHVLGLVNPNLLPRTRAHNAFFWPAHVAPDHVVQALAPFWGESRAWAGGLAALALLGAGLARPRARSLWFLGTAALVVAPVLAGQQPRYAVAALPLIGALAGAGWSRLAALAGVRDRPGLALVLAVLLGGATGAILLPARRVSAFAREPVIAGRSVVPLVARVPEGAVASVVDLTPELAWHLRGRRVLSLPKTPEELPRFLERYGVTVVVAPAPAHPPWLDSSHPDVRRACSLDALEAVTRLARRSALTVEADPDLRARAYWVHDLRGGDETWPFVTIDRTSVPWLFALHSRGVLVDDEASRQAFRVLATPDGRAALAGIADEPGAPPSVRRAARELARRLAE